MDLLNLSLLSGITFGFRTWDLESSNLSAFFRLLTLLSILKTHYDLEGGGEEGGGNVEAKKQ